MEAEDSTCAEKSDVYSGKERRSWQKEAEILHGRLESIEEMARDTQYFSRLTHETLMSHVEDERSVKESLDELITLWRGSKLMVSGFKILIPVFAAILGTAIWVKDHFRW